MLTHRRHSDKLSSYTMLFAEEGNESYGAHIWTLETELPHIEDCEDVARLAAEFYGIDLDEAKELVNPSRIVSSAGAWDDEEFVSNLWHIEGVERPGYRTYDGAVVLDVEAVKLNYSVEC